MKLFVLFRSLTTLSSIFATTAFRESFDGEENRNEDLKELFTKTIDKLESDINLKCICVICDDVYLNIFRERRFGTVANVPRIMIVVRESEDLLSPSFSTLKSITLARKQGCELYVIFLSNVIQVSRLLKFGERYRILNTRAKFILLHDFQLFRRDMHYIWRRIINVVFVKRYTSANDRFELSTVPFPLPLQSILVTQRFETWKTGNRLKTSPIFPDKTSNLKGFDLQIVALEHIPAVVKKRKNKGFTGIEVMVMQTISNVIHFKPVIYEPYNVKNDQWGHKYLNGSFSGLMGEMVQGKADVALGNLHYTPYNLQLTDLSIPYISQCLTFLTPESLTDNSWKTLILPFKFYMWIAVLIVLFLSGFIFYGLANFHKNLNLKKILIKRKSNIIKINKKSTGLYLFEKLPNSILYTYGMLLVVSLPKLPPTWSIRLLTGWYWIYCILVVVSYKASMTAILANPAPRVTIDTMQQLSDSSIICGGWGDQTKQFFLSSLDEIGQKIGRKFVNVRDANVAAESVAKGDFAYYENIYFLQYLIAKRKLNDTNKADVFSNNTMRNDTLESTLSDGVRNLHVMKECAIHMPISIGFQKNSPMKPKIDKLLRRIIEAGLIAKWLDDATTPVSTSTTDKEENNKALMNLQKLYAGFVALGVGYSSSVLIFIAEHLRWNYVVKNDPNFDRYVFYSRTN